jgi:hypothetical protein
VRYTKPDATDDLSQHFQQSWAIRWHLRGTLTHAHATSTQHFERSDFATPTLAISFAFSILAATWHPLVRLASILTAIQRSLVFLVSSTRSIVKRDWRPTIAMAPRHVAAIELRGQTIELALRWSDANRCFANANETASMLTQTMSDPIQNV